MSDEHLYSNWMRDLLPKDASFTEETIDFNSLRSPFGAVHRRTRQGRITAKKVGVVCQRCNGTWMSGLENGAKPFLKPMILGQFVALNAEARKVLAQWIVLKILIMENERKFGLRPVALYDLAERQRFMADREIPFGVRIWLGYGTGKGWQTIWSSCPAHLEIYPDEDAARRAQELGPSTNIESVTWGVGNLRIFAVATTDRNMHDGLRWRFENLFPLWPLERGDIIWPPHGVAPKTDFEMDQLSLLLKKAIEDAQASHKALFPSG